MIERKPIYVQAVQLSPHSENYFITVGTAQSSRGTDGDCIDKILAFRNEEELRSCLNHPAESAVIIDISNLVDTKVISETQLGFPRDGDYSRHF